MSERFASPLLIEIALWYFYTPPLGGDFAAGTTRAGRPAIINGIATLVELGLLEVSRNPQSPRSYDSTKALGVYVEALTRVPFPVQRWIIPEAAE